MESRRTSAGGAKRWGPCVVGWFLHWIQGPWSGTATWQNCWIFHKFPSRDVVIERYVEGVFRQLIDFFWVWILLEHFFMNVRCLTNSFSSDQLAVWNLDFADCCPGRFSSPFRSSLFPKIPYSPSSQILIGEQDFYGFLYISDLQEDVRNLCQPRDGGRDGAWRPGKVPLQWAGLRKLYRQEVPCNLLR